ncbi:Kinase-like [Nakaseomyces bracarensis]|uniref:Kinase-like n=1 Tax=Nakaseomyces bracarensis TaxID=273131 RepID=A0ABR4NV98_9SACH
MATIPKRHTYAGGPDMEPYTRNPYMPQHRNSTLGKNRKHVTFGPYIVGSTLGEGEFGKVKLGWTRSPAVGQENRPVVSKQVAIKLIRRDTIAQSTEKEIKIYREINALKHLTHPNIVRLEEVLQNSKYIGIVLEYASGGEFYKYIQRKRRLKESTACRLFAQLISGVRYMHSKNLVHRDLKLENLLLDKNENLVITDFGFVNEFLADNEFMRTSCGSPCYAAPELVISTRPYLARKADVWSCGIILYAMLAGYLPWDDDVTNPEGDDIGKLYQYITKTPLKFPEYITPIPRDLLRKILRPDPNKRVNLQYIQNHEWLKPHRSFLSVETEQWDRLIINSKNMSFNKANEKRYSTQPVDTRTERARLESKRHSEVPIQAMNNMSLESSVQDEDKPATQNLQPLTNVLLNTRSHSARAVSYTPGTLPGKEESSFQKQSPGDENMNPNPAAISSSMNKYSEIAERAIRDPTVHTRHMHTKPRPTSYYPVDIDRSTNNVSPIVLNLGHVGGENMTTRSHSAKQVNGRDETPLRNEIDMSHSMDESRDTLATDITVPTTSLAIEKKRTQEDKKVASDLQNQRITSVFSSMSKKSNEASPQKREKPVRKVSDRKRFSILSFYNGADNKSNQSISATTKDSTVQSESFPSVIERKTNVTADKTSHRASVMIAEEEQNTQERSTARKVIDFFKRRSMRM